MPPFRLAVGTLLASALLTSILPSAAHAQQGFVNYETPTVHPLDLTPDQSRLLAVNLPDGRLEVFDLIAGLPVPAGSVPVGYDPVSVRARTNTEVWVVNQVSDSVSVIDLTTMRVVATLSTDDEPCDVVFAGTPERAFVSCSQPNAVLVFDPADLSVAPTRLTILGEDPRALAVSPDRSAVYLAVFESGNRSTILGGGIDPAAAGTLAFPPNVVSDPLGPWGGVNPPPNDGPFITPAPRPGNPPAPRVGLIVKKDDADQWMDDNGGNWTDLVSGANASRSGRPVGWDLYDHDVAIIDASSLDVSYATGLMNINMAIATNPATGEVAVVGTEAINEVRFEPNVNGIFVRVHYATFDPASPASKSIVDLNPHLDYTVERLPQAQRNRSIGDPRAVLFNPSGTLAYVAGLGSNNVIVIDPSGARSGLSETIPVGQGPSGLAISGAADRLYVLNRFDASISVVDLASETVIATANYYDPTPEAIVLGRPFLYDTHLTSGLGQTSCASCHVDARTDRLAWDLGDPSGAVDPLTGNNLGAGIPGLTPGTTNPPFSSFHPMKGPMTTQTMQDIIGHEPHHWRGDRRGIEAFNGAFVGLLGDDTPLTPDQMQRFEDYLSTIHFPPNPFRNLDNSLPMSIPLPNQYTPGRFAPAGQPLLTGNPQAGLALYRSTTRRLDGGAFACVTCHTLPTGAGPDYTWNGSSWIPFPIGPMGEHHLQLVSVDGSTNRAIKTPQLRAIYDKIGFETTQLRSLAGFGVLHDGSVDSLARFVAEPAFRVNSDAEVANLVAFLLTLSGSDLPAGTTNNVLIPPGNASKDAHAAVGKQTTLVSIAGAPAAQVTFLNTVLAQAVQSRVGLTAKGLINGEQRGFAYDPGISRFRSDRVGQTYTDAELRSLAAPGSEITYTVVPKGTEIRIGIDRDQDGWLDRDELDVCANPADPVSYPGGPFSPDVNADLVVDILDLLDFLQSFAACDGQPSPCDVSGITADINDDGITDVLDLLDFLQAFAACE
jgi:YVTN family beta-propeller protein